MMKLLHLTVILLALGGCTQAVEGPIDPPIESMNPQDSRPYVLVDLEWNHTNRPGSAGGDIPITDFDLGTGFERLEIVFRQIERPLFRVFADAGRAHGPNDTWDQGAFANIDHPGEVHLEFRDPPAGPWTLTLLTDEAQPMGQHRIHVRAVAYP